jgi:hypothetical protein
VGGIPLPPFCLRFSFCYVWVCFMSQRREERSERAPKSSKERRDVWVVSTPYKLLIRINIVVL